MGLLKKIFKGKNKEGNSTINTTTATNNNTMGCSQSKTAMPPKSPHSGTGTVAAKSAPKPKDDKSTSSKKSAGHTIHDHSKKETIMGNVTSSATTEGADAENKPEHRRFASFASGASTPEYHSDGESSHHSKDSRSSNSRSERKMSNPKMLTHSTSAIGLDEMIEDRREMGNIRQNVVHIEVPFGKPIEEVYEGVHSGPVLGSGISGLVRLVTHKATGIKYAVKVLDLALVDNAEGLEQLREEIFIMCQLDHPNIVRLEEVYESQSEIYLVQELCLGGELFDRLDEQPDYHYTEAECARLVKQMLSAVRYLHSRGIIHRDLKLENFLFSSTSKDSELKMIDFGLSKHFRYGEVQHEAVGTPYTVAPEVIRGSYDERCDIWAIGVITFLLLSGDPPFGGCGGPEPLLQVRSNILSGNFRFEPEEIWANVSSLARDFIRDLLKTNPSDRPTARKAQQHPWLKEWASRSRTGDDHALNPNVVKALVNFKEFSDMRKLLCEVLSFTLLPYQIKELRKEFEKMDTDGSGEISLAALKQVLVTNAGAGSLGALTEEEVEDIFNAMRVRKTETRIHWHEFIAAGLSQCQVDDRNLRLAFERLDSDHKGYIILEDIMDLMGSDGLQSEDAMRRMWGDSVKSVKGQHARITYDDFLLLMKGQTKETPVHDLDLELESSVSSLVGQTRLHVVPEAAISMEDLSPINSENNVATREDISSTDANAKPMDSTVGDSFYTPSRVAFSNSAPATPADHKLILDLDEMDTPLSMDDDDDINVSGPGVPGCAASLTPPMSPSRGARDYVTPNAGRRGMVEFRDIKASGLSLPGLPTETTGIVKPEPYIRRRARSMDEAERDEDEMKNLTLVADAVRDMMLPETIHENTELETLAKDTTKSALVVNRKLYRAHRQMRLAILEASKRFEEKQAEHAKELILAARKEHEEAHGMIQAGLVMRHGHKKQVSSQAIRTLLDENRRQQQALVEKANRRGGRGRRSRKKTISDMSGMLSSMGQDDMNAVAQQASSAVDTSISDDFKMPPVLQDEEETLSSEVQAHEGHMRLATVPGEFRKTSDPFGKSGRYGAQAGAYM